MDTFPRLFLRVLRASALINRKVPVANKARVQSDRWFVFHANSNVRHGASVEVI